MLKPIKDASDQTQEEHDLVGHVRDKVEKSRSSAARISHEGMWMRNISYVLGFNGLSYNTTTRQFQPFNRATAYLRQNRINVNKILPTLQNRCARLAKNPPKFDVRPESNDVSDKDAARLGLQILTTKWDELDLNNKRIPLYMWMQECGHAYVKVSWDPTLGKEMVDPITGELGYEGDVRADVISALEVFPDPMAKTLDECQWIIHAKVRKLDYFRMQYPERGHAVKPENAWLLSAQYEQRINSINSRGPAQGGIMDSMPDAAIELVKYERRSLKHPQGRMVVTANGVLLEDKPLPIGDIPFAKFDDIVIGGKYYSEAMITHLVPIQDQYNETIRRRSEWTRRLLAGKYRAARGSGVAQEALNDESGEILYYDDVPGAAPPEPMPIPMIPSYAYTEEDRLNAMFNEISGINEPSKGNMPSADMPGISLQLLVEADETRMGIMISQHEKAWARVGQLILKHIEKFYIMPRKCKLAGKSMEYIVKEISGQDFKGNTDVMVIPGSMVAGSKALRRQEIINSYQQGFLGDPSDPSVREKVLDMLEYGNVAAVWQDHSLDMSQIRRGIEKLKVGEEVPVHEYDNHALWLQEINRLRKTPDFEAFDPMIQNLIMQNAEAHIKMLMKLSGAIPPYMTGEAPPPLELVKAQAAQQAATMAQPGGEQQEPIM